MPLFCPSLSAMSCLSWVSNSPRWGELCFPPIRSGISPRGICSMGSIYVLLGWYCATRGVRAAYSPWIPTMGSYCHWADADGAAMLYNCNWHTLYSSTRQNTSKARRDRGWEGKRRQVGRGGEPGTKREVVAKLVLAAGLGCRCCMCCLDQHLFFYQYLVALAVLLTDSSRNSAYRMLN